MGNCSGQVSCNDAGNRFCQCQGNSEATEIRANESLNISRTIEGLNDIHEYSREHRDLNGFQVYEDK